jgi:hypothetical protein
MSEKLTLFQRIVLLSLSRLFLLAFQNRAELWSNTLYSIAIAGVVKAEDVEILK